MLGLWIERSMCQEATEMSGKSRKFAVLIGIGVLAALVLVACGGGPQTINVTEKDYSITLSSDTMNAGSITFHVTNEATDMSHEFVIFKTDLPANNLPLNSDGNVDETQLNLVDAIRGLAAGDTQDLTVNLQPGHYVAICNLPGHYKQGMYIDFTVK
jgi:uncharacterized cupredoxin-like copper-binding protein